MKVTFRLPSKAVQYGYTEVETELADAGNIGEMYAEMIRDFWEGEKAIKTKPLAQADAEKLFDEQLGATVVGVEVHTHKFVYADDNNGHSGSLCECGEEESPAEYSTKPWDNKPKATAVKPWENKVPDLFA